MHSNATPKESLRTAFIFFVSLFMFCIAGRTLHAAGAERVPVYSYEHGYVNNYLRLHPQAPLIGYYSRMGAGPLAAGPLWSHAGSQTQVTFGVACALCFIQDAPNAVDGDPNTASRLVMPVGALGGIGQKLQFTGSYLAGDQVVFDLEVPGSIYTKQLLSAIQIQTFNAGVANNDPVTLDNQLIRVQVLGIGTGTTNRFRVVVPVTHDFDEVQIGLSALFAEFGSLLIYEAVAVIPVTVNTPTVIPVGGTTTLNASMPRLPGATFQWFSSPSGGTPLASGSSFTTPPLSRSTTYYIEASTGSPGLQSYVRTPVHVSVSGGVGPLWSYADQEQSPVTGGIACALCFVDNPNLAIDGDTTTASKLVLPVGVVTSVGQILKFPGSYKAGDNIVLDLQIPSTIYTKQLLSAVKIHTLNNGVDNADPVTLDNALIRLQALGLGVGSTPKFRVTIPIQKDFDAVQVDLSALFAEFGSLLIYEAVAVIPVTVNPPATIPVGGTATLNASMPRVPGATFQWFSTPTGGTPLAAGPSFTTPALSRNTTYYVQAVTGAPVLQSYVRTPVDVKVSGGMGPLWSFASSEISPVTGGIACALCFVDNPGFAVDADTTTASRIVLPVGVLTSVGQRLIFSGSYKAGDYLALDLEIPNKVYTKQALSGIQIESFNNNVSNGDVTTIGTSLIRLQVLGVGPGGINKFRVVLPVTKDFNSVQVSLSALFAEFGALKIYEAAAFIPVKVGQDSITITTGQPATLTASIDPRVASPTFRWYTTPSGGTPVFTGSSFTTPALTQTATYYVEAVAGDGLTSYVRTPVYVRVRGGAGSLWSYADDEVSPITGGIACALCFVDSPKLAVDADSTTASKIVLPVGVLTSAGQMLKFPGLYKAGDNISLDLEIPNKIYTKQALSGIQIETFNNDVSNNDARTIGTSLIRLQVLGVGPGGINKFRIIFPVLKDFDAVKVSLSSLFAEFGALKIYDAAAIIPITISPDSSSITRGGSATFNASIPRVPGATIQWFDAPVGGNAVGSGTTFTTPPLNRSTTYYAEATGSDGLKSFVRTPATVSVTGGMGPLWSYADQEQSPVTGGVACALCFVDNPNLAIDGDTTTASKLVLPVGVVTSVGQILKFPGSYKAGDNIALDLQIPGAIYTKQLLSAVTVHTLKNGVDNADPVTLNSSLIRLQALGIGLGSTPKFRVIIPVQKDFDAVQVDLSALFAEFGSLLIYEGTAFIPVTVTPPAPVTTSGGTVTLTPAIDVSRVSNPVFKWYTTPTGGAPVFTGGAFTTPPLDRNITYYVEAFSPSDGLNSYVRTAVPVKVGGGPGTIWSFGQDQAGPFTSGIACAACTIENPELAADGDTTTASKFITGIGIGTTLSQRVILPGVYQAGDSIVLIMDLPSDPLAGAQLLPNIKVQTYNNAIAGPAVANGDQISLNNTGVVRLSALGASINGTNKFRVTIPATKTFDAVEVGQGSLAAISSSLRLYEVTASIPVTATPSPAIAGYNKPATLNAAIRVPQATFKWYTTPTGGTPIPNAGATFTTNNLTRPTTFYVEATDPAGKTSFTRTAVPVKISGAAGPLWSYGTDQVSPITGGVACVLCTIEDSLKAIDGDTTTSSRLIAPLGVLGTVGQKIIFPGTYQPGDSIILFLSSPTDLLASLSLLGAISVETFNGTTANNDPVTLNSSLVNLSLLGVGTSGEKKYRVSIPATKTFDAVQVNLGGVATVSNSLRIYEVAASIPVTVAVTPTDTTVNAGQTAIFNASIPRIPDATFNWYETPTGGTPIATTNTFTTPPLTQNKTYYVEANSPTDGLISFVRTAVTVKVNDPITCGNPTSQTNAVTGLLCVDCAITTPELAIDNDVNTAATLHMSIGLLGEVEETVTFPALSQANDSLYLGLGVPGNILQLNLLVSATVTLYNGNTQVATHALDQNALLNLRLFGDSTRGLIAFKEAVPYNKVKLSISGVLAVAGSAVKWYFARQVAPGTVAQVESSVVNVCSGGTATLKATGPAGSTFNWYSSYTGGTPIFTGPTFTVPNVTKDTSYFVEVASTSNCTSASRTQVQVRIGQPSVAVTPSSATVTAGATPTFNVVNPVGTNKYNWYTTPTGGTPVFVGPTFTVPPVNATITYYVESTDAAGTCKSLRTPVLVNLTGGGPVNPPVGDIDCGGATSQLSNANGLCIGCYVEKQDSAVDNSTATSSSLHVVLGLLNGYTQQTLIFPNPGNSGDSVRLGLSTDVGLADVGVLTAISVSSYNGTTSNADEVTINDPGVNLQLLTGTPKATLTFKPKGQFDRVVVRLTSGIATALTSLNIYYAQIFAGAPTVEKDTVYACAGSPAVLKATGPGATFRWYTQQTGGSPIATGATYTINSVTANAVYYVEAVSGGGCTNPTRKAVTVLVGLPKVIVAPETVKVNSGSTATFTIVSPNPAYQYNWYDAPIGGTKVAGPVTSFTTPPLTAAKIYYVEAVDPISGCVSSQRTKVTADINQSPEPTPCSYATAQQSPIVTGICALCSVSNPGNAVDQDANSASTITATLGALGYVGQLLQFSNTYAAGDSVTLDLEVPGQLISAGLLGGIKLQTYAGTSPNGDEITLDNQLIRLELLSAGNRFRVTLPVTKPFNGVLVSINGAVSLLTSVNVYFAAAFPSRPVLQAPTYASCGGQPVTMTVTGPANADTKWYSTAVGGTALGTGYTFTTPALTTTTTYYVESGKFNCAYPIRVPVIVTVGSSTAAPTAPGVTICSGGTATLVATAPAGATFHWYQSDTSTVELGNGTSFVTAALTADTAYYVAADNNGCFSTRTRVPVTIAAGATNFTVTPTNTTVSRGQGAIINASATGTGIVFKWYNAAGDSIFAGPSFNTGPLQAAATYTVAAVSPGGCATPRITVTVNIAGGTTNDVPCDFANNQTNDANGICIGCYVDNPTLSVDSSTTTSSTMHIIAGLLGGYVEQTLIFPSVSNPGDSVNIFLSFPIGIADIGLLSSMEVATYNGTTFNNDRLAIGNSLLTLRLLTGNQQAILSFKPTSQFDRVELRLNSGVAQLLTAVNVHYAHRTVGIPTVLNDSLTVCPGDSALLQVKDPAAGVTYKWYGQASGGQPLFTGTAYQTMAITAATTFYVEASKTLNDCANPQRVPVKVGVTQAPVSPGAPVTVNVCLGSSADLSATTPDHSLTYKWYNVPTGGTSLNTDSGYVFRVTNILADTIYYVEAVNKCGTASPRQAISVKISSSLNAPVVAPNPDTVSVGTQAVLTATSNTANAVYTWFGSQAGTDSLFTGSTFSPPTQSATGTVVYWVEASLATCKSQRVPVTVVYVNGGPAQPVPCEGAISQTIGGSGLLVLGNVYNPQLAVDNDANTAASLVINLGVLNAEVWERAKFNGVSTAGDTVRVLLTNPSQVLSASLLGSVQLTTYNGSTPGDSVLVNSSLVRLILLSDTRKAIAEFVPTKPFDAVEVKLKSGIAGALNAIDFNYAQRALKAPSVQAPQVTVCKGATATLNVQNPIAGLTYRWFTSNGIYLAGQDGASLTTGALSADTAFYVESYRNGCASNGRSLINVTVTTGATSADINLADTAICTPGVVTLTASSSTVTNPVFKWYSDANLQNLVNTGATFTTPALSATTAYYVTVEGTNKCANAAGDAKVVTVTVATLEAPIINASSVNICVGDSVTLTVQNAVNTLTYRWYNVATGGTPLFTGPVYVAKGLTVSTDFYVEVAAGNCTGGTRTKISIGVGEAPVPILESNNVTVCQGGSAILKVVSSTAGLTYNWYNAPTGGTLLFTGPIFTTPAITTATADFYVEAVGDPTKCGTPSARAKATVTTVPVPPAPPVVSASVSVCRGQNAVLAVLNPQAGVTYQWFDAATGGTLVFTGPVFTLVADVNTTYYVQALIGGGCASASRTAVSVTASDAPAAPVVNASSQSVCIGGTVTLTVQSPATGVIYRWYDAATGGNLLFTGATYVTGPLNANTDFYVEATSGTCGSATRTKVSIGVGQAPTPTLESDNLTVCVGNTATLRVTSATNGITYNWYTTATGGTPVFTGPVYTTGALNSSMDFYVDATGDPSQCGSASPRVKATVTVVSAPAAPEVMATSLKTCAGTGITVAVKAPQAGLTYQWYDAATGGNLLFTGAVYDVPVVTSNTTFYVQALVGGGCASATRTGVSVTVDPSPAIPAVNIDNVTTCIGGTATFTVQNPDATLTYRWYDAPVKGNLLATGTSYTTGALGSTTTIYLEALNNVGCSSSRKGVTATVVTTIDAPLADPATTCAGQTIVLSVKNKQAGVIYRWYTAPAGGTAVFTGGDYSITPTANVTYYLDAATSGGCTSASRTAVNVTVNPAPAVPAVANATLGTCIGQTATLTVLNPSPSLTYRWYTTPTGGTPIATGAIYVTPAITANQMYYVEALNSNACPSATRTAVSVQATTAPASPSVTGNEAGVCPGKTATLTATSNIAGAIFRWYSAPTGGTPLFTGAVFTTNALTANTTYYVEVSTTGGCTSAVRTAATVNILQPLETPNVTVDNTTATSITFRWNPVNGATHYEVTLDNGVTFIPPSSGANGTTHTVSGLQPNQSVTIKVRAVGDADCQTSALSNGVTGKSANPQGNNIFIPNLFSPNGDGINDVEYVYGTAIAQLEFRIYNQWGQLIFTSKDQRQGWDGTMGGQKQPVGVYVWIVRATMQDGTVITKKGNVTLMR
ncbi:MAG TPA: gliding motility-associated C-terminal domain-containing protein [Chitinophaga sp.]|uniref:Ig-like domain-containing protein n=1 Tax=Chitinophaga sp. TaxID=1869181 RepID=UPI002CBF7873|nr:gliding motility-associated C-terminal domain-containing protein [Chitinophaga sp.]HVI46740.1 gliding motility-associated C-terminal domain-containing protein [Chitinophaga sp.]